MATARTAAATPLRLGAEISRSGAERQINRVRLYPHFATLGTRAFSPDARIRRLGIVVDDFALLTLVRKNALHRRRMLVLVTILISAPQASAADTSNHFMPPIHLAINLLCVPRHCWWKCLAGPRKEGEQDPVLYSSSERLSCGWLNF